MRGAAKRESPKRVPTRHNGPVMSTAEQPPGRDEALLELIAAMSKELGAGARSAAGEAAVAAPPPASDPYTLQVAALRSAGWPVP